MTTNKTIRNELRRRIGEEVRSCSDEGARYRQEALEEFQQWLAGEMAKEARQYIREHYESELADGRRNQ